MEQQQLVPTGGATLIEPGKFPTCGKGLWTLLTAGDDSAKALYAFSKSPALRDEAIALLPALDAAKAPVSREAFALIMTKQRVVFGIGDREAGEWTLVLEGFYGVLQEFSAGAIEEAFIRWNRGEGNAKPGLGAFFPQPSQLYPLAKKAKNEVWVAAYRARKALEGTQPSRTGLTAEQRAQERQKLIDAGHLRPDGTFNTDFGLKTMAQPSRPQKSPQQMARELREVAARRASDIGDVI